MGLKLIVMGTGPFAVPTLRWLVQSEHTVDLVVTRPIEDAGKRRKVVANPVHEFAESVAGLSIFAPRNVNTPAAVAELQRRQADLLFVCDYGQILKSPTLASTRLGGINLHGSLLPRYRGAAPVQWAIYHGETETGVTVIHMTPRLDGGPVLQQSSISIGENETAEELEPRLAQLGVSAVSAALQQLQQWDGAAPLGRPQDSAEVSQAPRLHKHQGNIDWRHSARQIFNQVRSFQPWPGSFTHYLPSTGRPLRLILHRVTCQDATQETPGEQVGRVLQTSDQGIRIAAGQGWIEVQELQPAGKKRMPVDEFLRGRPLAAGERFGDSSESTS